MEQPMRCKTLTAIYKNEINTLKKLYEIDFLIHKSVRIHIEQFLSLIHIFILLTSFGSIGQFAGQHGQRHGDGERKDRDSPVSYTHLDVYKRQ